MSLGKRKTLNEPLPKLAWEMKAGHVYTEVRARDTQGDWYPEQTVLDTAEFRAVFDMHNVEVGYIAYLKNVGLETKLVRVHSGGDYGAPPSVKHQEGFRLIASLDGVVHEML